ncbi:MAG TPA: electron transport complex subunit E [Bacteroidales bacterium]|nr:electron transport complex subunit E [Bacteroidales bacterium]HRZ48974.1 electron transport complex subunit E [Bacteroidales bacterium]
MNQWKNFTKGFLRENPVLVLILGTCPTLATSTSVSNGLGMGLALTFVLVMSNLVIASIKNLIPGKVRIPAFILVIATFVTIVDYVLKGYVPALHKELGVFIPLIVVNCIVLGRAEAYASKNSVLSSIIDGFGMGFGFTLALMTLGGIREILGAGTFFGMKVPIFPADMQGNPKTILIFILAPGAFLVYGYLVALTNRLKNKLN